MLHYPPRRPFFFFLLLIDVLLFFFLIENGERKIAKNSAENLGERQQKIKNGLLSAKNFHFKKKIEI